MSFEFLKLSPEAISFGSQYQTNDELAQNLLNHETFLTEYLSKELFYSSNYRPILNKITLLQSQSNNTEQHNIVDRVCQKILHNFSQNYDVVNSIDREYASTYKYNLHSALVDMHILSIVNNPSNLNVSEVINDIRYFPSAISIKHLSQLLEVCQRTGYPDVIKLTQKMISGYIYRSEYDLNSKHYGSNIIPCSGEFYSDPNLLNFIFLNQTICFTLNVSCHSLVEEAVLLLSKLRDFKYFLSVKINVNQRSDFRLSGLPKSSLKPIEDLITSLEFSYGYNIARLVNPKNLTNLKFLEVQDIFITDDELNDIIDNSPSLVTLKIVDCCISNIQIKSSSKLHSLTIIDCKNLNIISLETLPNFQLLEIHNCLFDKLTFNSLPKFNMARFIDCKLNAQNVGFLTQLQGSLRSLDLSNNQFISVPKELANMKQLIYLNLKNNWLGAATPPEFILYVSNTLSSYLPNLLQLSYSHPLDSILALSQLKMLELGHNSLSTLPIEIGNLFALETLDVSKNQLAQVPLSLGNLTNLRHLDLSQNQRLSSLPREVFNLNQLLVLDLIDTNIHSLPEEFDHFISRTRFLSCIQAYPFMLSEKAGTVLDFNVKRVDILQNLSKVLINLSKVLTTEHSRLFVKFEGEFGIDDSGLSKELFSKLFVQIKAKYLVDGLPYRGNAPKNEREAVFKGIGILLAFILRTEGRYPLGDIFSLPLYEKIINFPLNLLSSSYKELSLDQVAGLFTKEQKDAYKFEDIQKFCLATDVSTTTFNESIKKLFTFTYYEPTELQKKFLQGITTESIDGEEYCIIYDEDFLQELQKRVKIQLLKLCKDVLQPIFEICQGFYSFKPMLEARKQLSAEAIFKIIQGISSREVILSSLEFIDKFEPHQTTLSNWVQTAPKNILENFVSFSTGSSALKAGKTIKIYFPGNGPGINAHTCYDGIDISQKLDETTLIGQLNTLEPNQKYTNA